MGRRGRAWRGPADPLRAVCSPRDGALAEHGGNQHDHVVCASLSGDKGNEQDVRQAAHRPIVNSHLVNHPLDTETLGVPLKPRPGEGLEVGGLGPQPLIPSTQSRSWRGRSTTGSARLLRKSSFSCGQRANPGALRCIRSASERAGLRSAQPASCVGRMAQRWSCDAQRRGCPNSLTHSRSP